MGERILLAVDDSPASERSVEYVAAIVAGRADHYVHLVHVSPTSSEDRSEPANGAAQRDLLATLRAQLVNAGVQDDHADTGVLSVPSKGEFAEGLLDAARDQRCRTIVVGRSSLPWFREPFHDHASDELIKRARGFTVWVVE